MPASTTTVVTNIVVTNSAATAASFTFTYAATLPTVATLSAYYNHTFAGAGSSLVPSTGIYQTTTAGAKLVINNARNQSKDLSAFAAVDATVAGNDDMVAIQIKAVDSTGSSATGASVTLTAPTGGWVLNASGLPAAWTVTQ